VSALSAGVRDAALAGLFCATAASSGGAQRPDAGVTDGGFSYDVAGAGDPVVLIHGFGLDRRMWEPQMARLAQQFRVVRYDLRGHGRTTATFADSFAHHDDLSRVFEELEIQRAAIVGLSLGARIAVDFALAYPERVTRLVLASPGLSGYVAGERPEGLDSVMAAVRAGDTQRAAWQFAEMPMMAIRDDAVMHVFMRGIAVDNAALWGVRSNPERPLSPPAIARLASLRVPVLVIVGRRDTPDVRRTADTLAASAGARKVVVSGAGHMVNLAAARRFNELLVDFLRQGARSQPPR
jgi:pimeloyl-ACP methyl ester carboxylesterase